MQRSDAPPVASLPISLKIIFLVTLAVIVLGVIWSVMIFCIVFPPRSWKIFRRGQQHSSNVVEHTEARRDGIELQPVNNSGNTGHNAQPPSASTRRHSYTAQDDNPFSSRTTLSAASSPYNPFLDPPAVRGAGLQRPRRAHKVRSSREWKEAHAAFFGGAGNTVKSSTSEASKTAQQAVEEESAVAGAASIREERADVGEKDGGKKENGEDALVTKAVEKVDETLGMIDDAVDKAAEGIARWTENKKVD